jgi:hydrogenase expression/formation protein HypD
MNSMSWSTEKRMQFLDEYRDPVAAEKMRQAIRAVTTRAWTLMEICGGQTHTLIKYGIDELLPPEITLVHGPGCPVCVTPLELIDKAIAIAARPGVIFCSFGDMLRVPGSERDLLAVKAAGGDVRIVYSPLDCLRLAERHPDRTVVFFAVGFETTAPANAMAVWQAKRRGVRNFAVLVSHVLVPPAMTAILSAPANRVQGFLAAGHVCTIMGYEEYESLAERFRVPIVVTGFEPLDLLEGVFHCVHMLEDGRAGVVNQYARAVTRAGNPHARRIIEEVFEVTDRKWRGIGLIPASGYRLRPAYADFDAEVRFAVDGLQVRESTNCISGQILQGVKKPQECPAFGTQCTPEHPLGATMVSSEGACAAYYHSGRLRLVELERGGRTDA